ncbi:adenosine deaminase, putative [Talaromyces stipitatus ATCC 10500]|uniref:Adenosine deaminase, putative n=1 Tax=Talaromyces stipitatus (strain ATCC 10500 / CBS 375.48 / QM 6759 / NRRL 1006) TaxID=441959 RepID=B8M290_TALSN|nr:adenosine deaminase, putative [Talaromyces stipitatus ATCC 10500]EED21554.1 adenosine deaminase, putative [Talaromyces stipitatus ATCC 10500]
MSNASSSVSEDFTKCLPKIELHAHLSGSITRQCLHEIWLCKKAQDPSFAVEDPWVLMPPGKINYGLDIFFDVFSKSIYNLVNDAETILYTTKSVLNDFRADGVRYLELRTTPREIRDEYGHVLISKDEYVNIVLKGIREFDHEQRKDNKPMDTMSIYLILSIDRGHDTTSSAEEVVNIAIRHRNNIAYPSNPTIVGIDLCGNPLKGAVSIFRSAFQRAKEHHLGTTIHFAETIYSNENVSQELETLLSFEPDRLGHVIHVPDEIKEKIAAKKIALELCMSCNVHAKMIHGGGFEDHHFGYWWKRTECAIALCTDDVGFFCSPVSQEYLLASEHFGLGREELIALCERGVDSIFGGEEEKTRMRRLLTDFSKSNVQ